MPKKELAGGKNLNLTKFLCMNQMFIIFNSVWFCFFIMKAKDLENIKDYLEGVFFKYNSIFKLIKKDPLFDSLEYLKKHNMDKNLINYVKNSYLSDKYYDYLFDKISLQDDMLENNVIIHGEYNSINFERKMYLITTLILEVNKDIVKMNKNIFIKFWEWILIKLKIKRLK